jgi:hypothetical protein
MFSTAQDNPDVERDRWGRYLLTNPVSDKKEPFTRATTFAKSISDTFALSQWAQRMTAKGLALRPDLVSNAFHMDVKKDRDALNKLVEDAKAAAGDKVAANLGTARHTFTEHVDRDPHTGVEELVPEEAWPDVKAYRSLLERARVRVIPEMIERITAVPEFEVAGTLDRGLDLTEIHPMMWEQLDADPRDGCEVIGDLKTGRDLQYGWNEISIQLAIYAMGVKACGTWNLRTRTWDPPRPVRQDFALVIHLPVGAATATLYRVELEPARRAMALCRDVRKWRKYRVLAEPLAVADALVPDEPIGVRVVPDPNVIIQGPSWLERFEKAGSRGELSALFKEAVAAGVWSDTLKDAGVARLKVLEEKAG